MAEKREDYKYFEYDPAATRAIQQTYVPFFAGKKRVLDIACGRGEFLTLLKENGIGAVGVDTNAEACRHAEASGVEAIRADVFEHLTGSDAGAYDGVFMSHFVEHLPQESLDKLFKECWRVMADDGVIVVSIPSVSSIGMHLDWFYRDATHAGFRHPETVSKMLADAGFRIEDSGGNPATLNPYLGYEMAGLAASKANLVRNKDDIETLAAELPDTDLVAGVRKTLRSTGGFKNLIKRALGVFAVPAVKPYLDEISRRQRLMGTMYVDRLRDVNNELISAADNVSSLIDKIDHSFEDYIVARKARA